MKKILTILPLLVFSLSACKKESIDLTKKEDALKGYYVDGLYDLQYGGNDLKLRLMVQKDLDNNTPEQLELSVNGLPAGVTADIENNKGVPPFRSNIIFSVYGAPQPGKYPVTVKLTAPNGKTLNDTFYLTIPIFDYSMMFQGDIFLYPNNKLTTNNYIYTGAVKDILNLSYTNLPAGVSVTFSDNNKVAPFNTEITYTTISAPKGSFPVQLHFKTPSGQDEIQKMNMVITDSCFASFPGTYNNSIKIKNGITDTFSTFISKQDNNSANLLYIYLGSDGGLNFNLNCNDNTLYARPNSEDFNGKVTYTGSFSISPRWVKIQQKHTDPSGKVTMTDYELR